MPVKKSDSLNPNKSRASSTSTQPPNNKSKKRTRKTSVKLSDTGSLEKKSSNADTTVSVSHAAMKDSKNALKPEVQNLFEKDGAKVLGFLGSGAYSTVWKVQTANGKIRAAKVLDLTDQSMSKVYRLKFMPRELEVMKNLKDKNIVKVHEIKKKNKLVVVYMEYAEGGHLTNLLKNGPIPEEKAKPMFHKICLAVKYMHDNRMAHRDLKMENILIDKEGNPKLSDFSYSVVSTSYPGGNFLSRTFCGTMAYMPPEMLRNVPYDPFAADVWSMGVCFYICLNNATPFGIADDKNQSDVAKMITKQVTKDWDFKLKVKDILSKDVKDLITKMFEPMPKQRPTIYQVLDHKWFAGLTQKTSNDARNASTSKIPSNKII